MNASSTSGATRLMLIGIVFIVAGILSIISPAIAGKAVVIVIGVLLILAGIVHVVHGLRGEGLGHKVAPLVLGALMIIGGVAVLANPLLGLESLSLILAVFFVVEGIWKIVTSFSYRPASGWLAMLISGVLGFLLGWLIWQQWPLSGLWAVGVLVGVDLLTTGAALVFLSTTIRHLKRAVQEAVTA